MMSAERAGRCTLAYTSAMLIGLLARPARAQEAPLAHDPARDAAVIAGVGSLWIISETQLKDTLAPSRCRWCESDGHGRSTLNGFDAGIRDALRWSNHGAAASKLSDVTGFMVVPALAVGLPALAAPRDRPTESAFVDGMVVIEAAIIAAGLNQIGKFIAGRERPFVHAMAEADKGTTPHPNDNNLSFFSGHTTLTFALATAAGTITSMHKRTYAPLVWGSGLTLAAGTGYLRIAADKHYATDVIVGMIVGSLVGVGLPLVFHAPRDNAAAAPVPSSAGPAQATGVQTLSFGGAF
jgi:membrane-associated phospholipid phosphatase